MTREIGMCMSGIEITLDGKKGHDNTDSPLSRKIEYDIYDTVCCHENHEYIKKDEQTTNKFNENIGINNVATVTLIKLSIFL